MNAREKAQFATASRLLCSIVNESLCSAFIHNGQFAILIPTTLSLNSESFVLHHISSSLRTSCKLRNPVALNPGFASPSDFNAILVPILVPKSTRNGRLFSLDPDEIRHDNLVLISKSLFHPTCTWDPAFIWAVVARWNPSCLDSHLALQIGSELTCSAIVQEQLYTLNAKRSATPILLTSTSMDWENAIIEGHPTHPMHRTRSVHPPFQFDPRTDMHALLNPQIVFLKMDRQLLQINGCWDSSIHPQLEKYLNIKCSAHEILVPMLEIQAKYIQLQYPDLQVTYLMNNKVHADAQSSTRTVVPKDKSFLDGMHIKLALNMTITSAMRTISPYSVCNGPIMSEIAAIACVGNNQFHVIKEPGSIGLRDSDEHVAKSVACIIRSNPDSVLMDSTNQVWIVCSALVERDIATNVPHVIQAFNLDTQSKRINFLSKYTEILFKGIVPPLVQSGYAWEAHAQNTLVRVDRRSGRILGFGGRDFGGCMVDPTVWKSAHPGPNACLVDQLMPRSFQIGTREQGGLIVFHSMVHSHIHRLVRALGLHYNGIGWDIVRKCLMRHIPQTSWVYEQWFRSQFVPGKAFLRMKCDGLYRDYLYEHIPNVLLTGLSKC